MRRNTRVLLVLVLSILGAACWVMVAPPAQAELNGPCQATGAFAQGTDGAGPFTVDVAAVGTQTVTVPRQDSVSWTGSVPAAPGALGVNVTAGASLAVKDRCARASPPGRPPESRRPERW